MAENTFPKLFDPATTAQMLGVAEQTLAVWRCRGRYDLPFVKFSNRVFYRENDLIQFLNRHTHNLAENGIGGA